MISNCPGIWVSFCSLTKRITPNFFSFLVLINSVVLNLLCVWILARDLLYTCLAGLMYTGPICWSPLLITPAIYSPGMRATIHCSMNRQLFLGPTNLETLPNLAAYLFLDRRFDQGQGQSHVFPCHHAVVLVRIFFPPGILCNFIKGEVLGLGHQVFQVSTPDERGRANAWHTQKLFQLKHARWYNDRHE